MQFGNPEYSAQQKFASAGLKGYELQDKKVNLAGDAWKMLSDGYDPKADAFDLTKLNYKELGQAVGNLASNSSQASDADRKEIAMRTAKGDWNGIISYVSGTPQNANTQDVYKNLARTVHRLGMQSELEREAEIPDYLKGKVSNFSFSKTFANDPAFKRFSPPPQQQQLGALTLATGQALTAPSAESQANNSLTPGAEDPLTAFKKRYPSAFGG
jgi:hypothetical protein